MPKVKIDNEYQDDTNMDMLDSFDDLGGDFDFDMDTPNKPPKKRSPVGDFTTSALESTILPSEGTINTISSSVNRALPKTGKATSDVVDIISSVDSMRTTMLRDITPSVNKFKKVADRYADRLEGKLPKFLHDKIKKFTYTPDTRSKTTEELQQEMISEELSRFNEIQIGAIKQSQLDTRTQQLLDQRLADLRHNDSQTLMARTVRATEMSNMFLNTTFRSYIIKNLELSYKRTFLLKDLVVLTRSSIVETRESLNKIVHNTSLPDLSKSYGSERFKLELERKILGAPQDKITDWSSNFMSNLKENINTNIFQKMTETINTMSDMGTMMLEAQMDADDMAKDFGMEEEKTKSGIVGGLLGRLAQTSLIKKGINKLHESNMDKFTTFDKYIEGTRLSMMKSLSQNLSDNKNGMIRWIGDNISPKLSIERGGINTAEVNATDTVMNDMAQRKSIVEIIPGYLAKILANVSGLNKVMGGTPDEELVYDIPTSEFLGMDDFKRKSMTKLFGSKLDRTDKIKPIVKRIIDRYKKSENYNPDLVSKNFKHLIRLVANSIRTAIPIDPKIMKKKLDGEELSDNANNRLNILFKDVSNMNDILTIIVDAYIKGDRIDNAGVESLDVEITNISKDYDDKLALGTNHILGYGQQRHFKDSLFKNISKDEYNSNYEAMASVIKKDKGVSELTDEDKQIIHDTIMANAGTSKLDHKEVRRITSIIDEAIAYKHTNEKSEVLADDRFGYMDKKYIKDNAKNKAKEKLGITDEVAYLMDASKVEVLDSENFSNIPSNTITSKLEKARYELTNNDVSKYIKIKSKTKGKKALERAKLEMDIALAISKGENPHDLMTQENASVILSIIASKPEYLAYVSEYTKSKNEKKALKALKELSIASVGDEYVLDSEDWSTDTSISKETKLAIANIVNNTKKEVTEDLKNFKFNAKNKITDKSKALKNIDTKAIVKSKVEETKDTIRKNEIVDAIVSNIAMDRAKKELDAFKIPRPKPYTFEDARIARYKNLSESVFSDVSTSIRNIVDAIDIVDKEGSDKPTIIDRGAIGEAISSRSEKLQEKMNELVAEDAIASYKDSMRNAPTKIKNAYNRVTKKPSKLDIDTDDENLFDEPTISPEGSYTQMTDEELHAPMSMSRSSTSFWKKLTGYLGDIGISSTTNDTNNTSNDDRKKSNVVLSNMLISLNKLEVSVATLVESTITGNASQEKLLEAILHANEVNNVVSSLPESEDKASIMDKLSKLNPFKSNKPKEVKKYGILGGAGKLIGGGASFTGSLFKTYGKILKGAGTGAGNVLSGLGGLTGGILKGLGRGAGDTVPMITSSAGNIFKTYTGLLSGLAKGTMYGLTGVGKGVQSIIPGLAKGAGGILSGIGSTSGSIFKGYGKLLKGAMGAAGTTTKFLFSSILGTSSNTSDTLKSVALNEQALVTHVGNKLDTIIAILNSGNIDMSDMSDSTSIKERISKYIPKFSKNINKKSIEETIDDIPVTIQESVDKVVYKLNVEHDKKKEESDNIFKEILDDIAAKKEGKTIRKGSLADRLSKDEDREEKEDRKSMADNLKLIASALTGGIAMSNGKTTRSFISNIFNRNKKSNVSSNTDIDNDDNDSMLSTAADTVLATTGLKSLKDKLSKKDKKTKPDVKDTVKSNKFRSKLGKLGKSIGSIGMLSKIKNIATLGRVGTVAGTAATSTGLLSSIGAAIAGTASTIGSVLSAPLVLGALAVGGTAYGSYKLYKYYKGKKRDKLTTQLLSLYGGLPNQVDSIQKLEDIVSDLLQKGMNDISKDKFHELASLFDFNPSNESEMRYFSTWLNNRFIPMFVMKQSILKEVFNYEYDDDDKLSDKERQLMYDKLKANETNLPKGTLDLQPTLSSYAKFLNKIGKQSNRILDHRIDVQNEKNNKDNTLIDKAIVSASAIKTSSVLRAQSIKSSVMNKIQTNDNKLVSITRNALGVSAIYAHTKIGKAELDKTYASKLGKSKVRSNKTIRYVIDTWGDVVLAILPKIYSNTGVKIPPSIAIGLIVQESNGNPDATSHVGARGLTQIMPRTAEELADRLGISSTSILDDPESNILAGLTYLAGLYKRFKHWDKTLLAYNWGMGNVAKYDKGKKSFIPKEAREYAPGVLANASIADKMLSTIFGKPDKDDNISKVVSITKKDKATKDTHTRLNKSDTISVKNDNISKSVNNNDVLIKSVSNNVDRTTKVMDVNNEIQLKQLTALTAIVDVLSNRDKAGDTTDMSSVVNALKDVKVSIEKQKPTTVVQQNISNGNVNKKMINSGISLKKTS